jgi:acyl carrier protein
MDIAQARQTIAVAVAQVAPEIDLDSIDPDTELQLEADLDSMDFLNVVAAVAQQVGHDIPEHDFGRLATLNGFAAYLAETA